MNREIEEYAKEKKETAEVIEKEEKSVEAVVIQVEI